MRGDKKGDMGNVQHSLQMPAVAPGAVLGHDTLGIWKYYRSIGRARAKGLQNLLTHQARGGEENGFWRDR